MTLHDALQRSVNIARRDSMLAAEYRRLRESLLTQFPDIDEETLADTVEGESDLPDVLAGLIRAAREDKAMADALGVMIAESKERQERLSRRADKRRDIVLAMMELAGIRKLMQPDFTASVRTTPRKVVILDEDEIPQEYLRIKTEPDKTAIKAKLDAGETVSGAMLSNAGEALGLRWK